MWWEKFVFMAGRTVMVSGTLQMLLRRYIADSKLPEKRRALSSLVSHIIRRTTSWWFASVILTRLGTDCQYLQKRNRISSLASCV